MNTHKLYKTTRMISILIPILVSVVEIAINLIADQDDGFESIEKTSKKKTAKKAVKKKAKMKSPIQIESKTRQGE